MKQWRDIDSMRSLQPDADVELRDPAMAGSMARQCTPWRAAMEGSIERSPGSY
jgi:hypothetical protein